MPDGTVEVIVEGEQSEVEGFILEVNAEMSHHIRDQKSHESTARGEFTAFGIRF